MLAHLPGGIENFGIIEGCPGSKTQQRIPAGNATRLEAVELHREPESLSAQRPGAAAESTDDVPHRLEPRDAGEQAADIAIGRLRLHRLHVIERFAAI